MLIGELHTKFHDNRPTGSEEKDFEGFLPYMGMAAILAFDLDPANKLSFPYPMDAPHEI